MFAPNTIQSRLLSREDDDQNSLLNDVNQTIESLKKWKEEQRRIDEDLVKELAAKKLNQKVEVDEETHIELEFEEHDIESHRFSQAPLVEVSKIDPQQLISIPEVKNIENFSLYKAGDDLNQVLAQWNSELDSFNLYPGQKGKPSSEWKQVDEIEKELAELEDLMDGVDLGNED